MYRHVFILWCYTCHWLWSQYIDLSNHPKAWLSIDDYVPVWRVSLWCAAVWRMPVWHVSLLSDSSSAPFTLARCQFGAFHFGTFPIFVPTLIQFLRRPVSRGLYFVFLRRRVVYVYSRAGFLSAKKCFLRPFRTYLFLHARVAYLFALMFTNQVWIKSDINSLRVGIEPNSPI